LSPEVSSDPNTLRRLVDDIWGVSRKPVLGPAPATTQEVKTGYSPAATAIAKYFVMEESDGTFASVQTTVDALVQVTGLSEPDVIDGLYELRAMLDHSYDRVISKALIFAEFDKYWREGDPSLDGQRLAADLYNDETFPHLPSEIAERYGWSPRRLNSAITYLDCRELVRVRTALNTCPFVSFEVEATDATRRFLKSRG
jgi:hypothetical protein